MDTEQVVLVAIFHARPESVDELRGRLLEMVELTLQEPGAIQYELHVAAEDPTTFVFVETWVDAAALAAHDETPHVKAIIADVPRLTRSPLTVHRLSKVPR